MPDQDHVFEALSRVRRPRQDRSRAALTAALDSFDQLLRDRPLHRVTVQEVADRAGLSITSVYARFDGKNALVLALHERVIHDAIEQLTAGLVEAETRGEPVEETVRQLIVRLIAFTRANSHVYRAIISAGDHETSQRIAELVRSSSARLGEHLAPRLSRPVDEADRDIDYAWRTVIAVLQQQQMMGGVEPTRFPLDDNELAVRLSGQFLRLIGR